MEDCVYNPQWWETGSEFDEIAGTPHEFDKLQPSKFSWDEGQVRGLAMFFGAKPDRITLAGDTKFIAPGQFEPVLRLVESLVIRAAKEDFDPSEIMSAHRQGASDDDWVFIDRCWVSLEATRSMVVEATGAEAVAVTTTRGEDGQPRLSAGISENRSVSSLAAARERCLEVLPRWRGAMIPQLIEPLHSAVR